MKNSLAFQSKRPKMYTEETEFTFGQYKGQTLGEILKFDASYLQWCHSKGLIDVSPDLLDDIEDACDEQYDYHDDPFDGSWYESSDDPGSPRY